MRVIREVSLSFIAVFLVMWASVTSAQSANTTRFDLPAQPLADSLRAVGSETNTNILFDPPLVAGRQAPRLKAELTVDQALTRLLTGTGIKHEFLNERTVVLKSGSGSAPHDSGPAADPKKAADVESQTTSSIPESQYTKLARADSMQSANADTSDNKESKSERGEKGGLEEIVVTGTYIHNVDPITPLIVITHDDIVNQGYTTLSEVLEQLPQNFKGAASVESNPISGAGNNSASNVTFASGVNLRGLGGNATLVLLNGQRLAPTAYGYATDISSIPVDLIERVEILTDGASAVYGSDAVAGVVNVITRRDYTGVEINGRVNSMTEGKTPNYGGNALGGFGWDSGNVVLDVDYEKDNPLLARNRSFSASLPATEELLPKNEHSSYYLSLQNAFSDQLTVTADALVTQRAFSASAGLPFTGFSTSGTADQYSESIQLNYKITPEWTATLAADTSKELDTAADYYVGGGEMGGPFDYTVSSVEPRIDGKLIDLPGGAVRLAVGGQLRWEKFDQTQDQVLGTGAAPTFVSAAESSRNIKSAYTELLVPIIGKDNATRFAKELKIDLSARYDDYSDFGPTTNPKVVVQWVPLSGLALHGSYAKSFQAPTTYETSNAVNFGLIQSVPDPKSPTGSSNVLEYVQTGGPLEPETATTFNVGVTFEPAFLTGVKLDASFFSINFKNQIIALQSEGFYSNVLQDEAELGSFVERNPSAAMIEQALSVPGRSVYNALAPGAESYCVVGSPGCPSVDPSSIAAIANIGFVNAASNLVRGVDFALHYLGEFTPVGRFRAALDGTYFTTYQEFITPTSANLSPLNTVYFPLRFRAKANVGWALRDWAANARINYSNAYNNSNAIEPSCPDSPGCRIAAWTTVDLSVSYTTHTDATHSPLSGIRVSLDAFNVFNRAPPVVIAPPNSGYPGYDPTNANPLLRTFGISFTKKW